MLSPGKVFERAWLVAAVHVQPIHPGLQRHHPDHPHFAGTMHSALSRRRAPLDQPEDTLARTARRAREGKACVDRQVALIEMLDRAGHEREANEARHLLLTLQNRLELILGLLRIEYEARSTGPVRQETAVPNGSNLLSAATYS